MAQEKHVITGEVIFTVDIAHIMIDTIDARNKSWNELKFRGKIAPMSFKNFVENFSGLYLRTRTYIKNAVLLKSISDFFNRDDLGPLSTEKTAKDAFALCDQYIDAINRSELMKLIKEVTSLQEQ